MTITAKKPQRIKLILDLINKKRLANPEKETFYFQYEEFIKLPLLNDQVMLDQLFNRIQKESDCIVFILPKIPEHIMGKVIIEEGSEGANVLKALRNLNPNNREDLIELDAGTIKSFSTITVHIEDFEKFNKYRKSIERELKEERVPMLILDNMGQLYIKGGEGQERSYPMKKDGSRYRIVYFLAKQKEWLLPRVLAEECEVDQKKIGKRIEQIRREIEKFLKIEGNRVIEGKKGIGYRIKNIKVKET